MGWGRRWKDAQGKPGGNKYRARKTVVDGITFDSRREARRYQALRTLERFGDITDLRLQVRYPLMCGDQPILIRSKGYPNGRRASYVADFVYFDARQGRTVIEDAKGYSTPLYRLKRAILEANGYQITEV